MQLEQHWDAAHGLGLPTQLASEHHWSGASWRRGASKPRAPLLRRDPASARAAQDQRALELGNAKKYG